MRYNDLAAHVAANLGIHRTTLVAAIRAGRCPGEEVDGRWYTASQVAADWYAREYRHSGALYSQTAGRAWTDKEVANMRDMLAQGADLEAIAAHLRRAKDAVKVKISKLRASGALPPAAEAKRARARAADVARAREILAEEAAATPAAPSAPQPQRAEIVPCRANRQLERDGKLRVSVHPKVKAILGAAARARGISLAVFLTRAGLAAVRDPNILEQGLRESEKIGRGEASPVKPGGD